MDITDDTFYVVEAEGGLSAFNERPSAIEDMQGKAGSVGENEEFGIYEVEVGNEWSIVSMDWRSIALELMGEN